MVITIPYTIGFWMIFAGEVEADDPIHKQLEIEAASNPNGEANVGWVGTHFFYRQLGCLAFSLRFWPKIKPFPASVWTFFFQNS